MSFFSNFFSDKVRKKAAKEKPTEIKLTEEERVAQEVAHVFRTVKMPYFSISLLADFFKLFNSILMTVESVDTKYSCVRKLLDFCGKLLISNASLHLIYLEDFHPSFEIKGFLEGLLTEPLPLRARHVLALHRFCTALKFQLEEVRMIASCTSLEGIKTPTGRITMPIRLPLPPSQGITIDPCHDIDLRSIYLKLLEGDLSYLPTVEEYNEIINRTSELLRKESTVLEVRLPAVLVGDIHGQMNDLLQHVLPIGGPLVSDSVLNTYRLTHTSSFTGSSAHLPPHHFHRPPHFALSSTTAFKEKPSRPSSPARPPPSFHSSTTHKHHKSHGRPSPSFSAYLNSPTSSKYLASENEWNSSSYRSSSFEHKREVEEPVTYLFLGDYVDRGRNSLQCLCLLYVAKLLSPQTIFLLRGNHECGFTNRHYGFLSECHTVYPIRDNKVTSHPFSLNNSLTSPTRSSAPHTGKEAEGDPAELSDNSTMPLPTVFSFPEDEDDDDALQHPSKNTSVKRQANTLTSPACSGPLGFPGRKKENVGEGEQGDSVGFLSLAAELPEHPLWTAANESFKCLPLAAGLIGDVLSEEDMKHVEGAGVPVAVGVPSQQKNSSPSTFTTSHIIGGNTSTSPRSPLKAGVPSLTGASGGASASLANGTLVETCGEEPEGHAKKKPSMNSKADAHSSHSHSSQTGINHAHHIPSFASSWSGISSTEKSEKGQQNKVEQGKGKGDRSHSVGRHTSTAGSLGATGKNTSKLASSGKGMKKSSTSFPASTKTSPPPLTSATPTTMETATGMTPTSTAPVHAASDSFPLTSDSTNSEMLIVAMHGGISPYIKDSIDGILAIDRFGDIFTGALADITWSDPLSGNIDENKKSLSSTELRDMALSSLANFPLGGVGSPTDPDTQHLTPENFKKPAEYSGPPIGFVASARGTGHGFGEDATCKFINTNKIYFIVRAHQCVKEGFRWCHKNRILTLFSAANYCGLGNKGAVLLLDKYGFPTTKSYGMEDDSTNSWPAACPPSYFS